MKKIDKIMKIRMFKQALCKEVMPTLPECFMGIDKMLARNSLTQDYKNKTC